MLSNGRVIGRKILAVVNQIKAYKNPNDQTDLCDGLY